MQTPEEFLTAIKNIGVICESKGCVVCQQRKQRAIALIAARDAEWQARVDKAADEAVSEARKVARASEDYRALQAHLAWLEAEKDELDTECTRCHQRIIELEKEIARLLEEAELQKAGGA